MACSTRIGLIVLGYIKLILISVPHVVSTGVFLFAEVRDYIRLRRFGAYGLSIPEYAATELYCILDLCFCVMLLVAAHKKRRGLLRVSFWCALAAVVLCVLYTAYVISGNVMAMVTNPRMTYILLRNVKMYFAVLWFGLAHIVIQIIILVLIRKEMKNVQKNERSAGSKAEVQAATGVGETELRDV